jgi:hypothetical protein
MHISVTTWSNPTAKIYYTRDSQRKCLCFLISLHPFPYQNICYISEVLDHSHSLSTTCNHLPQQMTSLQFNIKRQEAMFIWNNTQWLSSWLVKVTSQLVFMNICSICMVQQLHAGVLFNMSDTLKKLKTGEEPHANCRVIALALQ